MKLYSNRIKLSLLAVAVIIFLFLSVVMSNYLLDVNCYKYSASDISKVKIVFISDLHGRMYGKNNSRLINIIENQEPDIICLGGDFIDKNNTDEDNTEFLNLCEALVDIAPVYYSYGNHDLAYFESHGFDILDNMEQIGCTVLNEEYIDIQIDGTPLRIGGMFDYAFNQQYLPHEEWVNDSTYKFLQDFTDTDRQNILLCHRPESFIYGESSLLWDIDYVLCGHTHGGIWRFPLVGGIIAPEQGLFPEYDYGEFELENIKMIISSGLSGYKIIPRLFNSPEITVIELN